MFDLQDLWEGKKKKGMNVTMCMPSERDYAEI